MQAPAPVSDLPQQRISDLVDGRLDGVASGACCDDWACDADLRRTWHTYHLIGDVLRSDDLAVPPAHDAAFLARLRDRLAHEPVLLAPAPLALALPRRAWPSWQLPVAVAAGFVAVAGVLVVLRQPAPPVAGPTLAQNLPVQRSVPTSTAAANAQMLRDAQVDEYLRAHREAFAGSPAALPGGAMRNVDLTVPQR